MLLKLEKYEKNWKNENTYCEQKEKKDKGSLVK